MVENFSLTQTMAKRLLETWMRNVSFLVGRNLFNTSSSAAVFRALQAIHCRWRLMCVRYREMPFTCDSDANKHQINGKCQWKKHKQNVKCDEERTQQIIIPKDRRRVSTPSASLLHKRRMIRCWRKIKAIWSVVVYRRCSSVCRRCHVSVWNFWCGNRPSQSNSHYHIPANQK